MRVQLRYVLLAALAVVLLAAAAVVELFFPTSVLAALVAIVDSSYVSAILRTTVPIAFAALGGIFAEKSGVINIGLEGLLIISAFTGIAVTHAMANAGGSTPLVLVVAIAVAVALLVAVLYALGVLDTSPAGALALLVGSPLAVFALWFGLQQVAGGQAVVWMGFLAAVLASTLLTLVFAVITIRYEADQIIAGLAVWLIALGLAPFASQVIWGTVNSPSTDTLSNWTIPFLSEITAIPLPWIGPIPFPVGPIFFDANPTVYMLLVATPVAWYVMNRTTFGRWVRASGENPKALDTAGVDVTRVRYVAVLISGVLSGIGGAGLALGQVGQFIGSGQTMVAGRGWIGITAYLFGNYNPIGAFGAAFLFAALDALQIRVQQIAALNLPPSLVRIVPFVTVIVVLAAVGRTRIPEAAGEHYESGEE